MATFTKRYWTLISILFHLAVLLQFSTIVNGTSILRFSVVFIVTISFLLTASPKIRSNPNTGFGGRSITYTNWTWWESKVFGRLIGDPVKTSCMMVDEVMSIEDLFQVKDRPFWMQAAHLQSLCWIAGSINGRRLTDPRSVTISRALIQAKIGVKQQKTDLFDRLFCVTLGGPDGVRNSDA